MSVSYVKFCPRCKSSTALDTAICARCGHQFRSHLVAPVSEKTISMQSPVVPVAAGETSYSPAPRARPALPRIPRPLLALVVGILAFVFLVGSAVRHALHPAAPPRAETPAAGSPYDIVFQSDGAPHLTPIATQTDKDLTRWLQLEQSGSVKGSGDDYPETMRLYQSGRVLLIADGTHGRVLEDRGAYRQVKILDGLHEGSTGFVSQDALRRVGQATSPAGQVLSIP